MACCKGVSGAGFVNLIDEVTKEAGMKVKSLKELYVEELRDVYDAESQIVKALPKMIKATSEPKLRQAFESHLEETRGHVQRLEQIFNGLDEPAKAKKCDGMRGILDEGEKTITEGEQGAVLDAGLIAGAQRVEHYEMAAYGSLKTWATQLGENEAAQLLEETLNEEKKADEKLSQIATSGVNAQASRARGASA